MYGIHVILFSPEHWHLSPPYDPDRRGRTAPLRSLKRA
jgi:hypothetical protein